MDVPFTKLHHVCVVVRDIDAAQAFYESVGIGPWIDYPPLGEYTDLDVPDPDGFRALKYRYAWIGEQQWQLCEPGRATRPSGASSRSAARASSTSASRCRTRTPPNAQAPVAPLMRGRRENGSGFTYFDTAAQAGVILEIRQSPPA